MIVYLENKEEKKELVFARVLGDRKEIRKRIDESKYGNVVDKYCLKKYINEAMLVNHNGFNESMFCNPNDVMEKVDIDFDALEEIFNDIDYDEYIKNARVYASRLLILKSDVMPFIKLEEMNRISYTEGFYNEYFERMIKLNTEILKLINTRKTKEHNYDSENVQNILNNDSFFDDYFIEDAVLDMDKDEARSKVKKLKKD